MYVLQCAAVCCSVLQCAAVCCSVLQYLQCLRCSMICLPEKEQKHSLFTLLDEEIRDVSVYMHIYIHIYMYVSVMYEYVYILYIYIQICDVCVCIDICVWQIPLKMPNPQNPPNRETQSPRYKFKLIQHLNLNLYSEIPRNLSFSIWQISGRKCLQ